MDCFIGAGVERFGCFGCFARFGSGWLGWSRTVFLCLERMVIRGILFAIGIFCFVRLRLCRRLLFGWISFALGLCFVTLILEPAIL